MKAWNQIVHTASDIYSIYVNSYQFWPTLVSENKSYGVFYEYCRSHIITAWWCIPLLYLIVRSHYQTYVLLILVILTLSYITDTLSKLGEINAFEL